MFTQRVALFNRIGNYRDLLIQYQPCIRSARPKEKINTKFVYDELANESVLNFEVSVLFQALVSRFKTFIEFSKGKKRSHFGSVKILCLMNIVLSATSSLLCQMSLSFGLLQVSLILSGNFFQTFVLRSPVAQHNHQSKYIRNQP